MSFIIRGLEHVFKRAQEESQSPETTAEEVNAQLDEISEKIKTAFAKEAEEKNLSEEVAKAILVQTLSAINQIRPENLALNQDERDQQ